MVDVLLTLLVLALGGLALRWAVRVEPHWASRDGRRLTARVQRLADDDQPEGRWREVRAVVTDDGDLVLRPRGVAAGFVGGRWRLTHATVDSSGRRALYEARRSDSSADVAERMLVRIPTSSRAKPVLDHLARMGRPPSAP